MMTALMLVVALLAAEVLQAGNPLDDWPTRKEPASFLRMCNARLALRS